MGEDGGAGEVGVGWEGGVLVGVEGGGRGGCCCGQVLVVGEGVIGGPVGGAPESVFKVLVNCLESRKREGLAVNCYVDFVGFGFANYFCAIGVEVLEAGHGEIIVV